MPRFDVILFDVGGVLLTNSWDCRERAAAAEKFHLDGSDFEARHMEIREIWERGAMTMGAYLNVTVFHEPRSFSRDQFVSFMLDQSKLLPDGAMGILKELALSDKYLLGTLNNEARETNEYRFKAFGLRRYFDVALSSCYVGLRKPEIAMYQRALDILGGRPERILFIEDREENIAGAKHAGFATIHYESAAALRRDLEKFEVL